MNNETPVIPGSSVRKAGLLSTRKALDPYMKGRASLSLVATWWFGLGWPPFRSLTGRPWDPLVVCTRDRFGPGALFSHLPVVGSSPTTTGY